RPRTVVGLSPNSASALQGLAARAGNCVSFLQARASGDGSYALNGSPFRIGRVNDRFKGLSNGPDDYLGKPFAFENLLAHVRASLRSRAAVSQRAASRRQLHRPAAG